MARLKDNREDSSIRDECRRRSAGLTVPGNLHLMPPPIELSRNPEKNGCVKKLEDLRDVGGSIVRALQLRR